MAAADNGVLACRGSRTPSRRATLAWCGARFVELATPHRSRCHRDTATPGSRIEPLPPTSLFCRVSPEPKRSVALFVEHAGLRCPRHRGGRSGLAAGRAHYFVRRRNARPVPRRLSSDPDLRSRYPRRTDRALRSRRSRRGGQPRHRTHLRSPIAPYLSRAATRSLDSIQRTASRRHAGSRVGYVSHVRHDPPRSVSNRSQVAHTCPSIAATLAPGLRHHTGRATPTPPHGSLCCSRTCRT